MAEGFELYHVPQQSRRDKLRVTAPPHNSFQPTTIVSNNNSIEQQGGGCVGLLPLYDPSLVHLDLLTCAGHGVHPHSQSSHLLGCPEHNRENPSVIIKGESPNFMGFPGNTQNPSNSSSSPTLFDTHGSLSSIAQTTTTTTTENNNNSSPFLYPAQNREFDHSSSSSSAAGGGGELVLYRPEPLLSKQGLSLSLSSHSHLPMELNFQYPAPPGPFTGYTSVLNGSMFLRPAQQLLQEICDVGGSCSGEKMEPDLSLFDPPTVENYSGLDDMGVGDSNGFSDQADNHRKSRLISMLDEVYRRYKQYYQQLQAVVASFESIPGLNNAAPFANFALKALAKHFKCLKTAITDQLQFMNKAPGSFTGRKHGESDENDKFVLYSQRPIHNSARIVDNQPVWRPQRGLPERAVSVLRSWLFEHFLHPYPTDTDKMMLAKQTGLSRSQVSNWFINARVRLWKPMVEEIHALETRQQARHKAAAPSNTAKPPKVGQTNKARTRANPSSSSLKTLQDTPPEKRVRNELADMPLAVHQHHNATQLNLHYDQFGVGTYPNPPGGNASVSLTLALHQNNNGINGLLDQFPPPVALAQRYGLPASHDGCVVDGGFEPQNRHFGARDVMGGQLLHDFVG